MESSLDNSETIQTGLAAGDQRVSIKAHASCRKCRDLQEHGQRRTDQQSPQESADFTHLLTLRSRLGRGGRFLGSAQPLRADMGRL